MSHTRFTYERALKALKVSHDRADRQQALLQLLLCSKRLEV